MFSKLSEEEIKEAKEFWEKICSLWYENFEKYKKENKWRAKLLLNWCRICKNFPELNKKREEYVAVDVILNQSKYEDKIRWKMNSWKWKFIEEHMIESWLEKNVKYRIFRQFQTESWNEKDEYLIVWIPFTAMSFYWTKFWQWIEVKKSLNPVYFEWILKNIPKYNWNDEVSSNSPKYNKSAF